MLGTVFRTLESTDSRTKNMPPYTLTCLGNMQCSHTHCTRVLPHTVSCDRKKGPSKYNFLTLNSFRQNVMSESTPTWKQSNSLGCKDISVYIIFMWPVIQADHGHKQASTLIPSEQNIYHCITIVLNRINKRMNTNTNSL